MNVLDYIGKTPLVKLRYLPQGYADVYVKLESANPGGSIKTRVAAKMIENAEKRGLIKPGDTIIEATGGNTGIGLAIACNVKGYKLLAVVPDNYSKERIKKLSIYGAKVLLSDSRMGNDSHIKLVKQLLEEHPEYTKENAENFAELYASSGVPESMLKLLIRNEYIYSMDYEDRPVADIWFDPCIEKALEIFGE